MSTRNRLHNVRNPAQTNAKKVLCICSAGLLRSPTAANVLHREFGYNTRAAGLTPEYALVGVDEVLLTWAEEIVVMEQWMADEVARMGFGSKVLCLNVPDRYDWMEPCLQQHILGKYRSLTCSTNTSES